MFIFAVPKHTAHKNGQKINYVQQKTFIDFYKRQFKTGQLKIKKLHRFGLKNDLWTLNYNLPTTFSPLSTWKTTKTS